MLWHRRHFIKWAVVGMMGVAGGTGLLYAYRKSHVLDIVTYPDPTLRRVSTPIDRIDDGVIALSSAMLKTLRYRAPFEFFLRASLYKGLSAPQVGVAKRLIVCGLYGEARVLVNPEILESNGSFDSEEYCMSLPRHGRKVINRPNSIKIRYQGLDNTEHTLTAKGATAALLAHEIDHLNGVLYIDYA